MLICIRVVFLLLLLLLTLFLVIILEGNGIDDDGSPVLVYMLSKCMSM